MTLSQILLVSCSILVSIFFVVMLAFADAFNRAEEHRRRILYEEIDYSVPASRQTIRLSSVSSVDRKVRLVDVSRTRSRNFVRFIYEPHRFDLSVKVSGVPSRSFEAVQCRVSEVDCRTREGMLGVCTHMKKNLSSEFGELLFPKNYHPDEGWCLPESLHARVSRKNCNPLTGDWLITNGNNPWSKSANLVCKCRYPNLMTQRTVYDDCAVPVGCTGGRLDDDSRNGLVDPYLNGRCICQGDDLYPSYDSSVGPICARKKISELERILHPDVPALPLDFMSEQFRALFVTRAPSLPDPCRLDVITGRVIADENESCRASYDPTTDSVRCVDGTTAKAITSDGDYLRNNHGRYNNACVIFRKKTIEPFAVAGDPSPANHSPLQRELD